MQVLKSVILTMRMLVMFLMIISSTLSRRTDLKPRGASDQAQTSSGSDSSQQQSGGSLGMLSSGFRSGVSFGSGTRPQGFRSGVSFGSGFRSSGRGGGFGSSGQNIGCGSSAQQTFTAYLNFHLDKLGVQRNKSIC